MLLSRFGFQHGISRIARQNGSHCRVFGVGPNHEVEAIVRAEFYARDQKVGRIALEEPFRLVKPRRLGDQISRHAKHIDGLDQITWIRLDNEDRLLPDCGLWIGRESMTHVTHRFSAVPTSQCQ